MKYFCAECKTKHDTSDIAADMWSICANEIICAIERIRDNMQVEQLDPLNAQIPIVKAFNDAFHNNSFIDPGDGTDVQAVIATTHDELLRFLREPQLIGHKKMALSASKIRDRLVNSSLEGSVISGTYSLSLRELFKIFGDYLEATIAVNSEVAKSCEKYMEIVPSDLLDYKVYDKQLRFSLLPAEGGNNEQYLDRVTGTDNDPRCLGALEIRNAEVRSDKVGFIRVCPHCGKRLSRAAGTAPEIVIALAGSPRAGKTSCMTAIASALRDKKYTQHGIWGAAIDNDPVWDALLNEIEFYKNGYAVTKTPIEQDSAPAYSLPINITNRRRVLTFVDMPGEFWADQNGAIDANFFRQYQGIYSNIDCIWFFISKFTVLRTELRQNSNAPDTLNKTRAQLAENTADDAELIAKANHNNIEASFSKIRDGLRAMGKELPPVAVIVTKPDVCENDADERDTCSDRYDLFPVGGEDGNHVCRKNAEWVDKVLRQKNGNPVLVEKEYFLNSIHTRSYIKDKSFNLYNAIQNACPLKTYMSIAAYGIPAKKRDDLSKKPADLSFHRPPNPYKEIFPLLWTLSICGCIKVRHVGTWQTYWLGKHIGRSLGLNRKTEQSTTDICFDYREEAKDSDNKVFKKDIAENLLLTGRDALDKYSTSIIHHARN